MVHMNPELVEEVAVAVCSDRAAAVAEAEAEAEQWRDPVLSDDPVQAGECADESVISDDQAASGWVWKRVISPSGGTVAVIATVLDP